ncbi:GDSL-type esterase/lipase family protein [uncultured Cyclobacterium sp.]|uniref:SGNH/GDSL hydrolase family protein n=1 Tax=uncultured Cyclobacterium sp. TaxID=453820 RepID=UPI0030ED0D62|tara:strand:+ start:114697 stop:115863 length:1167 start_codon:yes stop_codon:yes gene_type:complete
MKNKILFPISILLNLVFLIAAVYFVNKIGYESLSFNLYGPAGGNGTEINALYKTADKNPVSEVSHGIRMDIQGESLVLAATNPGKLSFDSLISNSVIVRSKYQRFNEESVVYEEGVDYTVDYNTGEIRRTENSNIPDYATHVLYGLKDFDHRKFPDYTNHPFFVWVDYVTKNGASFAQPNDQSKFLSKFREKLVEGTPVTIVSYGNSITAGGEASSNELRFQYLYGDYLRSKFPNANLKIEDTSISGYTSSQGIKWWSTYIGKTTPDLVLLGWGMNDHNIGSNSPEQYKQNLIQLVEMVREEKKAEVIIYSTFPPNDEWHYGSHSMEKFAQAAKEAALEANCAYVDVYSTWMKVLERKDQSSLLGNNINHPNDFGHWLYAQAFEAMTF